MLCKSLAVMRKQVTYRDILTIASKVKQKNPSSRKEAGGEPGMCREVRALKKDQISRWGSRQWGMMTGSCL